MAVIRGADSLNIRVEGLKELEAQFARIGKMPKKHLTRAARKGMDPTLKDARASAPVGKKTTTSGTLKKSIKKKMETPNKRNKGVYRLAYDPKFTDIFRKPTTGVYGGVTPEAYYPNSVEYGYLAKHGRVAGKYNMAKAVARNTAKSGKLVVDSLNDSIDELLRG
jgi:hypothetical protein